jgi:F-type H+-transporting ATPase subunit b
MININWSTLLLQILNFGIMVFILSRVFFKPVVRMLDERAEQVTKALDEAQEREQKAAEAQAEYEKTLAESQEQVLTMQQKAQEDLLQTKQQVLSEAREQVSKMRETAERDLEQSRQEAIAEHRAELGYLAIELSGRLMRQAGGTAFQEASVNEFLERLSHLQPERYRQELGGEEVVPLQVQVVSAQALEDDERAELEAHTSRLFEREVEVRYRVDPSLIAGATMRFGGVVIDGSLSGQLQNLNERYQSGVEREAA